MAPANPLKVVETMENILEVAWDCLEQTSTGKPNDHYISHGKPADGCCDALVIYYDYVRPSVGFGDARYYTGSRIIDKCCNVGRVADLVLELWRPCYPSLEDDRRRPFPAAEKIHEASAALVEDAWTLQCCIAAAHCDRSLLPDNADGCLDVAWGDLMPLGPNGGCAGFRWLFTVELGNCECN